MLAQIMLAPTMQLEKLPQTILTNTVQTGNPSNDCYIRSSQNLSSKALGSFN